MFPPHAIADRRRGDGKPAIGVKFDLARWDEHISFASSGGGVRTLEAPPFETDIALRLKRQ